MAFKFTIGRKIGTGFGALLLLTLIAFIFTIVTVTKSKQQTDSVVGQVTPSVSALKEFNFILQKSQTLISKWYFNQSPDTDPSKTELRNLISKDYPHIKAEIKTNPAIIFFYSDIIQPTPAEIRASRANLGRHFRWLRLL